MYTFKLDFLYVYTRGIYEIGTESRALFYETVACHGVGYIPKYNNSIHPLFGQPKMMGLYRETGYVCLVIC